MLVIGMTFICTLLFNLLEKSMLWLTLNTCCRRDKKLHELISKNMYGHQKRNNKTSIMFTLAISFMVFSSTAFSIITEMTEKLTYSLIGADIYVDTGGEYLDEDYLSSYLDSMMSPEQGSPVLDYAYVSDRIAGVL
jgi:hypothetical protein